MNRTFAGIIPPLLTPLTPDERIDGPELIDTEQGVPHLKGMRCALSKLSAAEAADLEARYGKTQAMPEAVERPGPRPQADPRDFMYDELRADDVEFDAIQLSMHGRTIKQ